MKQFLSQYRKAEGIRDDELKWGDEVRNYVAWGWKVPTPRVNSRGAMILAVLGSPNMTRRSFHHSQGRRVFEMTRRKICVIRGM